MPIYAYKCEACGHAKDVLQKMSDDPLRICPECGQAGFKKQLTAAGFQLKGSGWYATDFRGGACCRSRGHWLDPRTEPGLRGWSSFFACLAARSTGIDLTLTPSPGLRY